MSKLRFASLLAPFALALPLAAETIVVPPGSGLPAAIAAAQPGDTLLLQWGTYSTQDTPIVIDKSLTLIGTSVGTSYLGISSVAPLSTVLVIENIDADEEVRVFGIRIVPQVSFSSSAVAIAVRDCAGPVSLTGVQAASVYGTPSSAVVPAAVHVRNAAQLALSGCEIVADEPNTQPSPASGSAGLRIESSNVAISACSVSGGLGSASSTGFGSPGGAGVHGIDSTVRIARSSLRGGAGKTGFTGFFVPALAGDGAPALIAENSTIHVRGGPLNQLVGGAGSIGFELGQPDSGAGAAAAQLDASSLLTTTPETVLAVGANGDGSSTAELVTGTGAHVPLQARLATLSTLPRIATLGNSSTSELSGEPFSIGAIGFSAAKATGVVLPGFLGPIVLDLGALHTLPPFALGASGVASQATPLPATPSLAGLTVILQGFVVSPQAVVSVSAPTAQALVQ